MPNINENIEKKSKEIDKLSKEATALSEKAIANNYLITSGLAINETAKLYKKVDNFVEAKKFNRFDNTIQAIKEHIQKMGLANDSIIGSAIVGSSALGYYNVGYADETSLGFRLGFKQLKNETLEAFKFNKLDRITWIQRDKINNIDLINKIAEEIRNGLIEGDSLKNVSLRIKDRFIKLKVINKKTRVAGGYADALRIVRTETHRAYNLGKLKGFNQVDTYFDTKPRRKIVSVLDTRTRAQSASMDGKFANEQGLFLYPNGNYYEVPGNTGVAKYDINDRESVQQVFDEESLPETRKDNISKKLVPNTSFQEWAKLRGITKSKYGEVYKWD